MKKKSLILFAITFLACFLGSNSYAGRIGDFYQTISVDVNCDTCEDENDEREITIQLFADNEPVPDTETILNKDTGFSVTFDDLAVFRGEKTPEEIVYEARVLEENGTYRTLRPRKITHETRTVDKWVSVSPENLQDGHNYALLTENWNYEQNGYDKYVLIKGDINLESTTVVADYELVDGNKSYYSLSTEPSASAIWAFTKLATDDPEYSLYSDSWVITNGTGKRLVLSDFAHEDRHDVIWRYSGKNGYNEVENSLNTNKVSLVPVSDNRGRFRIAAQLNWEGELLDPVYYLGINHFYQVQAQTEPDYSAQLLAFEHITKEVKVATSIYYEAELCPTDNPQTNDYTQYYTAAFIVGVLGVAFVIKKNK